MHIIIVDDDAGSRASVARFLKTMGHRVTQCATAADALTLLRAGSFPVVLSDIKMPEMSGLDLLREISLLPAATRPKVVFFTGHGSMESAIAALRMGAYDYLLKPVKAEDLMAVVNKIAAADGSQTEARLSRKGKKAGQVNGEIGLDHGEKLYAFSPQMERIVAQALKYQEDRTMPLLIQGETGTGKELVARLIHSGGKQTDAPFVDINCAAISPALFESELFGYKGGSFTGGSSKDQEGKFSIARGGTIFLDEVAEIPYGLQAKLLRVVEEREYYQVGGLKKIPVDARIICATNMKLAQAVNEGKFRRDLYYRLQIGEILLPPLRERKEEILPLAARFLVEFSCERQKKFRTINKAAEKILVSQQWPGNIRELKNMIRWAVLMFDDEELRPHHLKNTHLMKLGAVGPEETPSCFREKRGSLIEKHVDQLVQNALDTCNGNKAAAARYLGISRRSLYRLLERVSS
ncbi:MAG: sigma-54 dependent transcriptional regulator [Negativicutes bacterium]|nr:sigma-54 dependent transcriptional regulator [Negativicutes bacterium]